jgi:hypothetical protein
MNSILLGVLQFGEQTDAASSGLDVLRRKFSGLFPLYDVEMAKKREQIKVYNDSIVALDDGEKKQVQINGQKFNSSTALREALDENIKKISQDVDRYDKQRDTGRRSLKSTALKVSTISSFAGGIGSQVAGAFSPSASRAVDNFSAGITSAGQVLAAFPNKVGKAFGAGFVAQGALSGLDTLLKGTENAGKALEIQQSRVQKLVSQLDSLSSSIVNLDSMFNDSSVQTSTLIKENRKYSETLAKLNLTPGGRDISNRLQSASTSQAKLGILNEFKLKQTADLDRAAVLQALREQFSNRKFLGMSSGAFAYSNDYDKENVEQLLNSSASTGVETLSRDFKARSSG